MGDDTSPAHYLTNTLTGEPLSHQTKLQVVLAFQELIYDAPTSKDAWFPKVRDSLDITEDRLKAILELNRPSEIGRALKARAATVPLRAGAEDIYPKDGWLGEYLLYCQESEVPISFHFWSAMTLLGTMASDRVWIDMNNHFIWPMLYTFLISQTADRKSQAIDTAFAQEWGVASYFNDILRENNQTHSSIYVAPSSGTWQGLLKNVERFQQDQPPKHKRANVAVVVDEMVTLFGKDQFGARTYFERLTDMYNKVKPDYAHPLAKGNVVLKNFSLSFIAGSTQEWIRAGIDTSMFAGGFVGRCIFITNPGTKRNYWRPGVLDPIKAKSLAQDMAFLVDMPPTEFNMSAWDGWAADWYEDLKDYLTTLEKTEPRLHAYYKRKQAHLLKTAMLLALSKGRAYGVLKDIEQAARLLEHEETHLQGIFREIEHSPETLLADQIVEVITRAGGEILETQLMTILREGGNITNVQILRAAEILLTKEHRVRIKPGPIGKGRIWIVPKKREDPTPRSRGK